VWNDLIHSLTPYLFACSSSDSQEPGQSIQAVRLDTRAGASSEAFEDIALHAVPPRMPTAAEQHVDIVPVTFEQPHITVFFSLTLSSACSFCSLLMSGQILGPALLFND